MMWLLNAFLQGLLKSAYGNVVFSRSKLHALHKSLLFFRSLLLPAVANLMVCMHFPGRGSGPGFSLSGRPSALDRTLNLWARRIFLLIFLRVSWHRCDFWMHFYRVCWNPPMEMSCFLIQNCTRFTKVSCFSVHFCSRLSPISCFACFLHVFVHLCGILCLCAAVCGREFLSRVDMLMQFYGVFWEPFIGMLCFLVQKSVHVIKVSCFSV